MAQKLRSQQISEMEKTENPGSQGIVHSVTGAAKGTAHTVLKSGEAVVKQVVGEEEPGKTYHDLGKGTIQKTADMATTGVENVVGGALDVGATMLGVVEGTASSVVGGATHVASKSVQKVHETVYPPIAKTADAAVDASVTLTGATMSGAKAVVGGAQHAVQATADVFVDTSSGIMKGAKEKTSKSIEGTHATIHPPIAKTADFTLHTAAHASGVGYGIATEAAKAAQDVAHGTNVKVHGVVSTVADTTVDTAHLTHKKVHDVVASVADTAVDSVTKSFETLASMVGATGEKSSEVAKTSKDFAMGEGTTEGKGGFGLPIPSIPIPDDVKEKHHEGRETAKQAIDSVKNVVASIIPGGKSE